MNFNENSSYCIRKTLLYTLSIVLSTVVALSRSLTANERTIALAQESKSQVMDFEGIDLQGKRRLPMQSFIIQDKVTSQSFGFIKMRSNWKDKIIQSTLSLDLGKTMKRKKKFK
jgi:hypothetical protein